MRRALTIFVMAVGCVDAQSVVATVERAGVTPGGDAVFWVRVRTGLHRSLASLIEGLTMAQIEPAELAGRAAAYQRSLFQEFLFRAVRPSARYEETQAALHAIASSRDNLDLNFQSGLQASAYGIDKTRAALLPGMFREAKARAERMLVEAGYRPGAIVELAESIEPQGLAVRLSLTLRMTRLGGDDARGRASVSTMVTPPPVPYRIGSPVLEASYLSTAANRAQLFEKLKPLGLTEADVTGVSAEPDESRREPNSEPGPVTFAYRFAKSITDESIAESALRLPEGGFVNVRFPVELAAVDPAVLAKTAQSRAALLASLLGGSVGEALDRSELSVPRVISGDFSILIPAERVWISMVSPVPRPVEETTRFRYRFAVE